MDRAHEPLLNSIRSGNYGGSDSHVFSRTRPGRANLDIFGHRTSPSLFACRDARAYSTLELTRIKRVITLSVGLEPHGLV